MSESFESKPPDVLTPPTGPGHFIEIQDSLPARINDQLQHAIGPYELLTRSLSEVVGRNGAEVPIASAEEFAREFEAWLTPERLE